MRHLAEHVMSSAAAADSAFAAIANVVYMSTKCAVNGITDLDVIDWVGNAIVDGNLSDCITDAIDSIDT